MKITITVITTVMLLIGCQSNTVTPSKSKQSTQKMQYERIQKESDGSYSVIINGKVKYRELKYATRMSCSHEILMLDKHNKKKVIKTKRHSLLLLCPGNPGDDSVYKYRAVQKKQQIELYLDILHRPFEKDRRDIHLASIPKSKADKVLFSNHRDHYVKNIENECGDLESIYYQKEGKYGILGKVTYKWNKVSGDTYGFKIGSGQAEYDALQVVDCLVKVQKEGRVGYLGHTDIKYKRIGVFKDGLARFTLPDGRSGWVTFEGKREFYD